PGSDRDTWIFSINPISLALDWQKSVGGFDSDSPIEMIKNVIGDLIVLSTSSSSNGDANNAHGSVDVLC
ncbi:hypothetical protein ACSTLM_01065, partial [Vibrio parahaemolyticus]